MKISEIPIAAAINEIGTRAHSEKYLPIVEKIRDLEEGKGNIALIIQSETKEEHNRIQGYVYGYNKRSGYKYRINQCTAEMKIFIRLKVDEDKKKKGRAKKVA